MTFKHHVSFWLTADLSHKIEKQILLYKITDENVSLTWSRCQISYMDSKVRACLHGGGGSQVGEVTRLGGVTCLSIQSLILM